MESDKIKKRYLLIGSIADLRMNHEIGCILIDEDDLKAIALKDLVGVAIVPFVHALTVEETCDGILRRVFYGRDLLKHHPIGRIKESEDNHV